jgi:large subunit ribosomal protein L18
VGSRISGFLDWELDMSKKQEAKKVRHNQRRKRVVKSISRSPRTRLTIHRTARHITAQLDDPETGKTVATVSTRSKSVAGESGATGNIEAAKRVGTAIAEAAKEKQISEVVFNRNGFLFHGRVKALADAAREAGLRF